MSNSTVHEETAAKDLRKKRKNRARYKVRAAWIAFIGRIVAQFVGSAASIMLALVLVGRHQPADRAEHAAGGTSQPTATWVSPLETGQPGPVVVVLPLDRVEGDAQQKLVAAIATALAQNPSAPSRPRRPLHRASGPETPQPNLVLARSLEGGSDPRK
jgi:hypothetical protein